MVYYFLFMELFGASIREIVVVIHALGAAIGIGTVFVTDYLFFKFLKAKRLSENSVAVMKSLSEMIWIALGILLASGIYLVVSEPTFLDSPKFILKMVIVGMILLNGLILNIYLTPKLSQIAFYLSNKVEGDAPDHVRKIAMFAGAFSMISWLSAFILGKMSSIPFSLATGIGIYFGILVLIALGASLTKPRKE